MARSSLGNQGERGIMDFISITGAWVWEPVPHGLRVIGGRMTPPYDAQGAVLTVGQPTAGP
jgi:hypothetical protein